MVEADPVLVINLSEPQAICSRCGRATLNKWGLPILNGGIVPTWWPDWDGGMPACQACYEWHEIWSDRIHLPFEAPLA